MSAINQKCRAKFLRRDDTWVIDLEFDGYEFGAHGVFLYEGPMYERKFVRFLPYTNLIDITITPVRDSDGKEKV